MKLSKKRQAIADEIEAITLDEVTDLELADALFPKRKAFYQEYKRKPFHVTCSCCGHSWDTPTIEGLDHCPNCNHEIELQKCSANKKKHKTDLKIAIKFEAHNGYQFVRYFAAQIRGIVGNHEYADPNAGGEVVRFVYSPNGDMFFYRKPTYGVFYTWWFKSEGKLELHPIVAKTYGYGRNYWFMYDAIIGTPTFSELFKYARIAEAKPNYLLEPWVNAFAKKNKPLCQLFETTAQIGKCEDLIAMCKDSFSVSAEFLEDNALLIMRGLSIGYNLDHEWVDNIRDLNYLGLPLSREYVFPADMGAMRTRLQHRIENKRRAERLLQLEAEEREMLPKALKFQPKYEKAHKRFFDVKLVRNGFSIEPLRSVKEFFNEGMSMSHCVFKCEYFKNNNLQIYSVKDAETGKRIETLSLNIKERTIQQCYGKHDTQTPRHNEIIELVNASMDILLPKPEGRVQA